MSAKDPTSREARAPRPDRRRFLGTVGTGAAAASLAGCIRKPVERILPYAQRPEDVVPGKPLYFATSMAIGDSVIGMHVESHEGRPTKVEGNPRHPDSMGSAHAWAQASVLDLYDGDRSTDARADGAKRSREDVVELLEGLAERADEAEGKGLAVLLGWIASPTVRSLLAELKQTRPHARIFVHDTMRPDAVAEGLRLAGAGRVQPSLSVRNAKVVLALDADILGTDGDSVRLARELADGRRVDDAGVEDAAKASMNRLYAVEATFSVTGMMADHRLRLAASKAGDFLVAVAAKVGVPADLLPKSRLPKSRLRRSRLPKLRQKHFEWQL